MGFHERSTPAGHVRFLGLATGSYPEVALLDGAAAADVHDETAIARPVRRESSETEIVRLERLLVAKAVHVLDVEIDAALC